MNYLLFHYIKNRAASKQMGKNLIEALYPILSKRRATSIHQLALKKHRLARAAFVLEGKKSIQALLAADYAIQCIVGTPLFFCRKSGYSCFPS
ncbi:MAG: hypothetical protein NMK33_03960 [Candidatus Cardinium sp.]|nr:MAG: hypothetical protein NMK33_03960 [Candidatus Cardinium sp.]